tara:strand:- start:134 stop:355 length:222 start_codon:yes stop_codon:yes gene_type:complete
MLKFINVPVFIVAFIIGIVFVYLADVKNEAIKVYPTPENAGNVQYKDKVGNCFVYVKNEITCPKSGAKNIPIQ